MKKYYVIEVKGDNGWGAGEFDTLEEAKKRAYEVAGNHRLTKKEKAVSYVDIEEVDENGNSTGNDIEIDYI